MQSQDASPRFLAAPTRSLRREGIRGKFAGVFLVVDVLAILGGTSGAIRIPPSEVERMRVGYIEGRYGKFFETRIWRKGAARPLLLRPLDRHDRTYGDIIRAFAGHVAEAGGLHRIERGETHFGAWLAPAAFALVLAAAVAVGMLVLEGSPWWQQAAPALIPGVLLAVFAWNAAARTAPRRVGDMAELDRQLP